MRQTPVCMLCVREGLCSAALCRRKCASLALCGGGGGVCVCARARAIVRAGNCVSNCVSNCASNCVSNCVSRQGGEALVNHRYSDGEGGLHLCHLDCPAVRGEDT